MLLKKGFSDAVRKARRAPAARARRLRITFADEARFDRINCPRPCWAATEVRPKVASQLIRKFTNIYRAVSPKDEAMPAADTECFQITPWPKSLPNSTSCCLSMVRPSQRPGNLVIPANIKLEFLPAYSPELYPQETLWDEFVRIFFTNYALRSMDEVYDKLQETALYLERNPELVNSITSFPYIAKSF
jgi:hypothetical protein